MNKSWQDNVIVILDEKQPKRANLVKQLMGVLDLNQESIYKRLREQGRVPFSVEELIKIANAFDVSFAHIIDSNANFYLVSQNYIDPTDEELKNIKNLIDFLDNNNNCSDLECAIVSNKLPRALLAGFENLNRLQLLKWAAQYTYEESTLPFSQTFLPKKLSLLNKKLYSNTKNIKNTTYILDYRIFENIALDIEYYCSINCITKSEKKLIKKDLLSLLDTLLNVAITGHWHKTSNYVSLYISKTNIEANYIYYYSKKFKTCRMQVFGKNEIQTNDPVIIDDIRKWLEIKKRSSNLISQADEKNRVEFFSKQREVIENL